MLCLASRRRSQQSRGSNALEMQNQLKDVLIDISLRTDGISPPRSKVEEACISVKRWFQRVIHSRHHRETQARRQSIYLYNKFKMLDSGMRITRQVFDMWLRDDGFLKLLDSLDINTSNKAELFDVLDSDQSGELEVEEIISGLMRMRGPPQKSDMIAALLGVRHAVAVVEDLKQHLVDDFKIGSQHRRRRRQRGAPAEKPAVFPKDDAEDKKELEVFPEDAAYTKELEGLRTTICC